MTLEEGAKYDKQIKFEKRIEQEKERKLNEFLINKKNLLKIEHMTTSSKKRKKSGFWFYLRVPVYRQINRYFCGPASVQEVVKYLSNKYRKQTFYAKKLHTTKSGTDIKNISHVLNKYTRRSFTCSRNGSKKHFSGALLYNTIVFCPTVLNVRSSGHGHWKYPTKGHFLPTAGVFLKNSKVAYVRVADPHNEYAGYYEYGLNKVYNAVKQSNTDRMVW